MYGLGHLDDLHTRGIHRLVIVKGLTDVEHQALELTAELTNLVCGEIIAHGPSREQDVREFVAKIHDVQHLIMAQAAARAHPARYRLLGRVIKL